MSEALEVEGALALACAAYMETHDATTRGGGEEGKGEKRRPPKGETAPHRQRSKKVIPAQQQQSDKEFLAHKQQVMANLASNACDNSPKGGVDRNCLPLMHVLNEHPDYVTTSSCGGRIALFHSVTPPEACGERTLDDSPVTVKRGGKDALGWLIVKHGVLTESEIDVLVRCLCGDGGSIAATATRATGGNEEDTQQEELGGVWVQAGGALSPSPLPTFGSVALKMEPFVMHVACRTMASAKRLLTAAVSDCGFRNSGVTPPGRRTMCAIRHATGHGLDVPLIVDGVNYVFGQHTYVRRLLQLANEKMRGNDAKLRRLEAGVAARLVE
ncbi:tRNA wybutosine-synthesizing protein 3 [Trypanosoma grayi]|uniref:tRNA wybutosine-synthesizing protein 3 n=1 Tax=Trypanosoma grayi TaxID=71804 RepID=UPI0004F41727|nr:tRNA wybutosine-synthesizing protein 3 [Trypanosoma grayi]KEG11718.1 tRNA wybutosine-synthesizing protein 3 [Trypanosoma grayi]